MVPVLHQVTHNGGGEGPVLLDVCCTELRVKSRESTVCKREDQSEPAGHWTIEHVSPVRLPAGLFDAGDNCLKRILRPTPDESRDRLCIEEHVG